MLNSIDWRALAVRRAWCPACEKRRWFVRLAQNEIWVRCLGCRSGAVTLSLISVLARDHREQLGGKVYELSTRGGLVDYLEANAADLTCSQWMDGVPRGETRNGIRCEDVQSLTFDDGQFDLVTSTEVFEHVPDDATGFREVLRVLKPNGAFVFTVPLSDEPATLERAAQKDDGEVEYLAAEEYHADPAGGGQPVLAFRTYGSDITDRLLAAGFARAEIVTPGESLPWGYSRRVVVGTAG